MEITLNPEEERVQKVLIEISRRRSTISCTDICIRAKLNLDMSKPCDWGTIGNMLGRISHYESQHGQPMLSAIVVGKNQSAPSNGFLITAAELGRNTKDKDKCWLDEMNRVYDYWSKH